MVEQFKNMSAEYSYVSYQGYYYYGVDLLCYQESSD